MTIIYLCAMALILGIAIRIIAGLFVRVPHTPAWLKLVAVLTIVAGGYAAQITFLDLETYIVRKSWPHADAVIVSSEIEGERAYRPIIVFQYSIANSIYIDTTDMNPPGFGNKRRRLEVAEAWTREYPVGHQIEVSYDPEDPETAFISLTPPWTDFFVPGLGVFLALVAGFVFACPSRQPLR